MNHPTFDGACGHTREHLDAYLDHELPAETGSEILRHLETCPACAADAEARGTLKSRVRAAARAIVPPPELAVRVRLRLCEEPARRWWQPAWGAAPRWAMAAAFALILGAGVWYTGRPQPLPALDDRPAQGAFIRRISAGLAGVLRPGLADHVHCAVFRRYPANGPSAAEMLAELGSYRDLLGAVSAAIPKSWHVVMAHRCSYQGRKYAHVILRDGDRLISLVVTRREQGESFSGMTPARTIGGAAIYAAEAGGFRLGGFESGSYLAFVVSDLEPARNLEAASLLIRDVSRVLAQNL
ncbi:MAG: zf-HC2 domain-containing protein [Acidobacteria bacterium]|nr:zf-HC2 domain-containing protein [Acidobacteriota bacterium]